MECGDSWPLSSGFAHQKPSLALRVSVPYEISTKTTLTRSVSEGVTIRCAPSKKSGDESLHSKDANVYSVGMVT